MSAHGNQRGASKLHNRKADKDTPRLHQLAHGKLQKYAKGKIQEK